MQQIQITLQNLIVNYNLIFLDSVLQILNSRQAIPAYFLAITISQLWTKLINLLEHWRIKTKFLTEVGHPFVISIVRRRRRS